MNFALKSLADAFRNVSYQQSHATYKLFGFLLATHADRHLIPEVLMHFNELHRATGEHVLLIAPSVDMRVGRNARMPSPEDVIRVFETGLFPNYIGWQMELVDVKPQIREFLRSLTEQSYELVEFLGLRQEQIPAMLFFENLCLPAEFALWDLRCTDATGVAIGFRNLLDHLREACLWEADNRIKSLEYELKHGRLGVSLSEEWEIDSLGRERSRQQKCLEYLRSVYKMREVADELLRSGFQSLPPLARARGNIQRLCEEPDNETFTTYLRRHRRNWKKRMPAEYRDAIESFLRLAAERNTFWRSQSGSTNLDERLHRTEHEIEDVEANISNKVAHIERTRISNRAATEREIASLRSRKADAIPNPISVLRSLGLYGMHTLRIAMPHPERVHSTLIPKMFSYASCFISYSSEDEAFVKRLRADLVQAGVRCWFAPEDLRIGDRVRQRIDESVQAYDKLLLVLSSRSLRSDWVESEVEAAFERERKQKTLVLFPVRLDNDVMETNQAWAANIRRTRHIGDFRDWRSESGYQEALKRLLRDLNVGPDRDASAIARHS